MADPLATLREAGHLLIAEAARLRSQLETGRTIAAGVEAVWIGPAETAFITELTDRERALLGTLDAIEQVAAELIAQADVAMTPD